MEKQSQLTVDCNSSEEPISSEKSVGDSNSESIDDNQIKPRLVKSDTSTMVDRKLLGKFTSLIKTLKETRCNLVIVDQLIGRDRRKLRSNKSETSLQEMQEKFRRPSSMPPLFRVPDCHFCGGDSCQDHYLSVEDNLDEASLLKNNAKIGRMCHSMQDLTILSSKPELSTRQTSDVSKMVDQQSMSEKPFTEKEPETSNLSLQYQLEMKEKQISELTLHLQDLNNKLNVSEGHRHQLLLRFEDILSLPLDVRTETEHLAVEMNRIEEMATNAQLEKNRLRKRARKIIQELKEKCKYYMAELQRSKDHEWELEQRCSRYSNEHRTLLSQMTNFTEKFQFIFKELENAKVTQMRALSKEELKNNEDYKEKNQQLLLEYDATQNKIRALLEEKIQLETQLNAVTKELELSSDAVEKLKNELKELQTSKNDIQAQFLAETTIRQAVETSVEELSEKLRKVEQRLSELQEKYLETINEHVKSKETLQQDFLSQKAAIEQKMQDSMKNQHGFYESRFTAIKLELAENQAELRTLQDGLKKEQEQKSFLKSEITRLKNEYNQVDNKYHQLCRYYLAKKKRLKENSTTIQNLQQRLSEMYEFGKSLESEFQNILRLIHDDIDIASSFLLKKHSNYPMIISNCNMAMQSKDWLHGIKSKLRWLTTVIEKTSSKEPSPTLQHTVSLDDIHINAPHLSPVRKSNSDTVQAETSKNLPSVCCPYPFNSTEISELAINGEKTEEPLLFKRCQRFHRLLGSTEDFSEEKPEIHDESSELCVLSTGQDLPTSSLSSTSIHSCEMPIMCME